MTLFAFLWLFLIHAIAFVAVTLWAIDAYERYMAGRQRLNQ